MGGELRLRDLDDDILARLAERAAGHGRTIEGELRAILVRTLRGEAGTAVAEQSAAEGEAPHGVAADTPRGSDPDWSFEARAARLRAQTAGRFHTPSEDLLRESRDER